MPRRQRPCTLDEIEAVLRDPNYWDPETAMCFPGVPDPGIIYQIRLNISDGNIVGEAARKTGIMPITRYMLEAVLEVALADLGITRGTLDSHVTPGRKIC